MIHAKSMQECVFVKVEVPDTVEGKTDMARRLMEFGVSIFSGLQG